MHQNKIWLGFLAFMSLVVIWFSGIAIFHIYQYWLLDATAIAHDISWSVKELSEERFAAHAKYQYQVKGQNYQAENSLQRPTFLNTYAADEAIKEFSSKKWTVWYNSWHPEQSTLQKDFPFKECISAVLLIGLLIYFIWLGFYVKKLGV